MTPQMRNLIRLPRQVGDQMVYFGGVDASIVIVMKLDPTRSSVVSDASCQQTTQTGTRITRLIKLVAIRVRFLRMSRFFNQQYEPLSKGSYRA